MLDVRRLAVLREFALRGTLSATAETLSFTTSAVSQQLAQLQREAGVALFRKVGRRLELTDAGAVLAQRAGDLLTHLDEIEAELADQAGEVRGQVRISAFQTAALTLVSPVVDRLEDAHPGLRIEFVEGEGEESLPLLATGGLDVVIAEEYEHAPRPRIAGVHREYLEPDEMLLTLPRDDPAASATGAVALASLSDRAWANARGGSAYADMFLRLCRTVGGFEPRRAPPGPRHEAAARLRRAWLRGDPACSWAAGAGRPGRGPSDRRRAVQPDDLRGRARERPATSLHRRGSRGAQGPPELTA